MPESRHQPDLDRKTQRLLLNRLVLLTAIGLGGSEEKYLSSEFPAPNAHQFLKTVIDIPLPLVLLGKCRGIISQKNFSLMKEMT